MTDSVHPTTPIVANSISVWIPPPEDIDESVLHTETVGESTTLTIPEQITTKEPEKPRRTTKGRKKKGYIALKKKRNAAMQLKRLNDPEFRKSENAKRRALYRREKERLMQAEEKYLTTEQCDCMSVSCPGCHFPCKICRSTKCGVKCRRRRQWEYTDKTIDENQHTGLTPNDSDENKPILLKGDIKIEIEYLSST